MVPKWPALLTRMSIAPKRSIALRDEVLAGGFIRYVRGDGDRTGPFALKLVGGGLRPVAVNVGRHDGRPFARQAFRYAEAHAAPGSGDDGCPVFESHAGLP